MLMSSRRNSGLTLPNRGHSTHAQSPRGERGVSINFDNLGAGEFAAGSTHDLAPGVKIYVSRQFAPAALVNVGAGDQFVSGIAIACTIPDFFTSVVLILEEPCTRAWVSIRWGATPYSAIGYWNKKIVDPELDEEIRVDIEPSPSTGREVAIVPEGGNLIWAVGFSVGMDDRIDNIFAVS
ncbi:hypothetical protein ACVWWJ_004244 [Luteibacter sp. HA06]|jgi:hypothetical protein